MRAWIPHDWRMIVADCYKFVTGRFFPGKAATRSILAAISREFARTHQPERRQREQHQHGHCEERGAPGRARHTAGQIEDKTQLDGADALQTVEHGFETPETAAESNGFPLNASGVAMKIPFQPGLYEPLLGHVFNT